MLTCLRHSHVLTFANSSKHARNSLQKKFTTTILLPCSIHKVLWAARWQLPLEHFSLRADVIFSETSADVEWGKIKTMTLFRKRNRLSTPIQAKADKLYVQTLILDSYRLQYQKMNLKIIETKNWRTMNRIEEKNTNIYFYRNRKVNRRLLDRSNDWIQFYMA